jgi:CHAT domain-containing protein/Tfp pilus assembly protein PilF
MRSHLLLGLFTATLFVSVAPVLPTSAQSSITTEDSSVQEEAFTVNDRLDESSNRLEDDKSYYNAHTFEGDAGQFVSIEMSSDEFDTYLILLDPNGNRIAQNDDSDGTDSRITFELPAAGRYTILANSYGAGATGNYTLTVEQLPGSAVETANRLFEEGRQLASEGQFDAALEALKEATDLYEQLNMSDRLLEAYQQVAQAAQQIEDYSTQADALHDIGNLYSEQEQYPQAIEAYQRALAETQQIDDESERLTWERLNLGRIALAYSYQGQTQQALEFYQQSLLPLRELIRQNIDIESHKNSEAVTLSRIGDLQEDLGQYDAALESYQRSLAIHRELQNQELEMQVLLSLGALHRDYSQHEQAIEANQQLLALARELNNPRQEIFALFGIGDGYSNQSEYSQALGFYQQALQVAEDNEIVDRQSVVLGRIAFVYSDQGDYNQALEFFLQALALEQSSEEGDPDLDQQGEGQALRNVGAAYQNLGQYDRALDYLQQALTLFQDLQDSLIGVNARALSIDTLNSIGTVYTAQGRYAEAIEKFQQALVLSQEANRPRGERVGILSNIGFIYSEQGNYAQALEFYEQSLEIAREIRDRSVEASVLDNIGTIYSGQGKYVDALALHKQALTLRQNINDRAGEVYSLNNLASILSNQGEYRQELELLQQALEIAQEVGNPALEMTLVSNIGLNSFYQGDYAQAVELFQQSLVIARELGDRSSEASQLHGLGLVYSYQGDFAKSNEVFNQALVITRELGDRSFEAVISTNLGKSFYYQAKYVEALEAYQQGLATFQELGERPREISLFLNLGEFYNSIGQYPQALEMFQQGLTIAQEIGVRPLEGNLLSRIGEVYENQGQNQQALQFYQQALQLQREMSQRIEESHTLRRLGNFYSAQGDSTETVAALQQSLQIAEEIGATLAVIQAQNSLGKVYVAQNQHELALELLQQAAATSRAVGDRASEAIAFSHLGELFRQQNQVEVAITFYKQSVNTIESIRQNLRTLSPEQQQSYTETISDTYRELADLLLSQGRILEAEQVLELLKIQEIREYTRGAVVNPETGEIQLSPAETEILAAHESLIAFASTYAECTRTVQCSDEMIERYQQLNQEWYAAVDSFAERVSQRRSEDNEALAVSNLQSVGETIVEAQPGTILIYPLVLEDKLWILWITEGGVANSIEVPVSERELSNAVLEFRQLMRGCEVRRCDSNADIQAIQTVSQQLYRWLIPPQLEAELEQNEIQNLVFALDRVIRYIPMAALFDGENYLIENYTISNITAAGLTNRDNPLPPGTETSVLALGLSEAVPANPTNGIPEFSPLPYVPQELNSIVRSTRAEGGIYAGLNLLNDDFHQDSLRQAPRHQILHIATHGLFDPVVLNSSFLVLGTKEPLRITDIERNLGATVFSHLSLVVLSACETALGEPEQYVDGSIPDGREISGIAQAFIDLGANTVVASLWQINDPATSALMQQFYGTLAQGTAELPVTISQSLQQAQLSLLNGSADLADDSIRGETGTETGTVVSRPTSNNRNATRNDINYSHPYYWAPFILIGNGL